MPLQIYEVLDETDETKARADNGVSVNIFSGLKKASPDVRVGKPAASELLRAGLHGRRRHRPTADTNFSIQRGPDTTITSTSV